MSLLNDRQPDSARRDAFGRELSGPLAGIVIADFSRVLAGPYCPMLLADVGATVIKVESPAGDETPAWKPPVFEGRPPTLSQSTGTKDPSPWTSALRTIFRRQETLLRAPTSSLRTSSPAGLTASAWTTRPSPNVAPLWSMRPSQGSVPPAEPPCLGYDLLVQAMSGLMSLTGDPELPAYRSGVAMFDVISGLHATIGVLSALHERSQSGPGQRMEVNLMSSALSGMVNQTGGFLLSGNVPTRMGNEHPSIHPFEPLPTADGEIVLVIGNDRQFRTLCNVIGAPGLADDPRFSTPPDRSVNRAALRPILQELLSARTASEWFDIFTESRLSCAPINDVRSGIDFAQGAGTGKRTCHDNH